MLRKGSGVEGEKEDERIFLGGVGVVARGVELALDPILAGKLLWC